MSNEKYAVAPFLKNIINQLFSSELIGEKEKKELRVLISETELDFGYSARKRDKVWGIRTDAKVRGAYKVRIENPVTFLETTLDKILKNADERNRRVRLGN